MHHWFTNFTLEQQKWCMLTDLSSANENRTTLLPFWKNYTGFLLRTISTTKLPHWLSGTLKVLFLRTFQNRFTPTNLLELFGPAAKNCWKSPKLTSNLLETDFSTIKQLKSGTRFLQTSSISLLFQEKSENTSSQRMLLSWSVKHLFCTVWLLSECVDVEEVVLIWLLMSCTV